MVSQTDTFLGQLIRSIFQYPYNHVSVTLDPELRVWYSFARYVQDAPFYGGFVQEPAERFLAKNACMQVRIFRIDISEGHAMQLEQFFSGADSSSPRLLYNYYEALACCVGLHVSVPNAHTCLNFAGTVLGRQFRSIEALSNELRPGLYFEGDLSRLVTDSGCRDDRYFSRMGLVRGTANALMQLGILSCRLVRHAFNRCMGRRFHRTVH